MNGRCGSKLRLPRDAEASTFSCFTHFLTTITTVNPNRPNCACVQLGQPSSMSRKDKIAQAITSAILHPHGTTKDRSAVRRWRKLLKALFTLYSIELKQHAEDDFIRLRQTWAIDDEHYLGSFEIHEGKDKTALKTKGTMGYSGSTFFTTSDEKYLVKSVPRHFEHSFFKDDFLPTYVEYMDEHLNSLIIRIADFLAADDAYRWSPGMLFGFAPSHHIVMENLLVGRDEGQAYGKDLISQQRDTQDQQQKNRNKKDAEDEVDEVWKWETWDLKPTTYFFPERDIAAGKLTSEATKSRLADKFDDKLILNRSDAKDFMNQLKDDTKILEEANAVDYSLFLVRIPVIEPQDDTQKPSKPTKNPFISPEDDDAEDSHQTTAGADLAPTAPTPSEPPFTPPDPPSWRTGIKSADGKYIYRAAILDFFWAKHKMYAKMMTKLVKGWNRIDPGGSKGPMSITTNSREYRERFLGMCEAFIEVHDQGDGA